MRRTQELPAKCPRPTHELLQLLTRPWTMHILWALSSGGPTRFGALRRQIEGISSRLLTERLRTLEEKGFIYRHYEPTIPPAVTNGLTKRMGKSGGSSGETRRACLQMAGRRRQSPPQTESRASKLKPWSGDSLLAPGFRARRRASFPSWTGGEDASDCL